MNKNGLNSILFFCVLFVLILFMGCTPTTDTPSGNSDSGTTENGNTDNDNTASGELVIKEIRFANPNGNALSRNDYLSWGNVWQIIETKITEELNIRFGEAKWNVSTEIGETGYDGISIATDVQAVTKEEKAALLTFLSDTFDSTITEYISYPDSIVGHREYDFTATHDASTGNIVVTYSYTKSTEQIDTDYYLVSYVTVYEEEYDPFHSSDWDRLVLVLDVKDFSGLLNTAFGYNWADKDDYIPIDDYSQLFTKDEYNTVLESLNTALDCTVSGYQYDFKAEIASSNKILVTRTITTQAENTASDYYFYNNYRFEDEDGSSSLTYNTSPSDDTFDYILNIKGFQTALDAAKNANLSERLWTHDSYTTFLQSFEDISFKVSGIAFDNFIPTYDYYNTRGSFSIEYRSTPVTDSSSSDYYEVQKVKFDYNDSMTTGMQGYQLFDLLGESMTTSLNTAFGENKWRISESGGDYAFIVYDDVEVVTHDTITAFINSFNNLDSNISGEAYDLTASHSTQYKNITVNYSSSPLDSSSESIKYIVDVIYFVDADGESLKDAFVKPQWEDLWPAIEVSASPMFTDAFGDKDSNMGAVNGWIDRTGGSYIMVNHPSEYISQDTFNTLLQNLKTLAYNYYSTHYNFVPEYNSKEQSITVRVQPQ